MSNPTALVQKLWNYCNILRADGLSYGDYVEQLTFLLLGSLAPARSGLRPSALQNPFRSLPSGSSLKMADEQSQPPFNKPRAVPKDYAWPSLLARDGRLRHCRRLIAFAPDRCAKQTSPHPGPLPSFRRSGEGELLWDAYPG